MRTKPLTRVLLALTFAPACALALTAEQMANILEQQRQAEAANYLREIDQFRFFDPNATGDNRENAYLLSQLMFYVYPRAVYDRGTADEGDTPDVHDRSTFEADFLARTHHFFWDVAAEPALPGQPPEPPHHPCASGTCQCAVPKQAKDLQTLRRAVEQSPITGIRLSREDFSLPPKAMLAERLFRRQESTRSIGGKTTRRVNLTPRPLKKLAQVKPTPRFRYVPPKGGTDPACDALLKDYEAQYAAYLRAVSVHNRNVGTYQARVDRWLATQPRMTLVEEDEDTPFHDPEAMVVSTDRYILIVLRGTDRTETPPSGIALISPVFDGMRWYFEEWLPNFDFAKISPGFGIPGGVHRGFWDGLTTTGFAEAIVEELNVHGLGAGKKVWITGHSLGAAQAQTLATYLGSAADVPVQGVYAFAAPHVGDQLFVNHLESLLPGNRLQRFDFYQDPATAMPPYSLPEAYQRAGTRNYYENERRYRFAVQERSVPENAFIVGAGVAGIATGVFGGNSMCYHHPNWYVRGAYNAMPRGRRDVMPTPPGAPSVAASNLCAEGEVAAARGE